MSAKPLRFRQVARRDVDNAIEYYVGEAGDAVALRFIDALEHAYRRIRARPSAGSPRFGQVLDISGLRSIRLRRFPYLIFYLDHGSQIEIWRVLHAARDIPTWLQSDS